MASPALAMLLSFALALPPGTSEDERLQAAREDYKNDRFAPAAWAFEALAKDFPDNEKYHYFAGLARENAGHDTHAALHLREFLASDAGTPEERAIAEKRLAAIAQRTSRVRVTLPPGEGAKALHITYVGPKSPRAVPRVTVPLDTLERAGVTYEVTLAPGQWNLDLAPRQIGDRRVEVTRVQVRVGELQGFVQLKSTPVLHELELTLAPPKAVRRGVKVRLQRPGKPPETRNFSARTEIVSQDLPPGTYTYEASARGFKPTQGEFSVLQPSFETITLSPKLDPQERRRRLTLGLSLAGAGLVTGVAGAALLATSQGKLAHFRDQPSFNKYEAITAFNMGDTGAGLLGATAGLLMGSASSPLQKRRSWSAQLGAGLALTVGGAVWYGLEFQDWRDLENYTNIPGAFLNRRPRAIGAAALLGMGVGLVTAGSAGLLSLRGRPRAGRLRANLSPDFTTKSAGLTLYARF